MGVVVTQQYDITFAVGTDNAVTVAFTVPAGHQNRLLTAHVDWTGTSAHTLPAAPTFDGVACTQFGPQIANNNKRQHSFYLKNPAEGEDLSFVVDPSAGAGGSVSATLTLVLHEDFPQALDPSSTYVTSVGQDTAAPLESVLAIPSQSGDVVHTWHGGLFAATPSAATPTGFTQDAPFNANGTIASITGSAAGAASVSTSVAWTIGFGNLDYTAGGFSYTPDTGVAGSATASGTLAGESSIELREGGRTLIATLSNETFVASFTDTDKLNLLNGLVAAVTQTSGWNNLRSTIDHTTAVARTSATVATVTLPPLPGAQLDHDENLTWTIPGSVLTGGTPIVATPTIYIAKKEPDPFVTVLLRSP